MRLLVTFFVLMSTISTARAWPWTKPAPANPASKAESSFESTLIERAGRIPWEGPFAEWVTQRDPIIYVEPNEPLPYEGREIMAQAEPGVVMAPGADRATITAALTPAATHLIMVDAMPYVVLFNQINIALYKLADSLEDYVHLRSTNRAADWRRPSPHLTERERALLSDPKKVAFFFKARTIANQRLLNKSYFINASPMRDRYVFNRIQQICRAGNAVALYGNLSDPKFMAALDKDLVDLKLRLALVDESNAFMPQYQGTTGVSSMIHALAESFDDRTVLMTTHWTGGMLGNNLYTWDYHGYRGAALRMIEQAAQSDHTVFSVISLVDHLPGYGPFLDVDAIDRKFISEVQIMNTQITQALALPDRDMESYSSRSGLGDKIPGGSLKYKSLASCAAALSRRGLVPLESF